MKESHSGDEIVLPDTPVSSFRVLLRYLYTGIVHLKDSKEGIILRIWFDLFILIDQAKIIKFLSVVQDLK